MEGRPQPVGAAVLKEIAQEQQIPLLVAADAAGVLPDGRVAGEDAQGRDDGSHLHLLLLLLRHLLRGVAQLDISEMGLHGGADKRCHGLEPHIGLPHLHILHPAPDLHEVLLHLPGGDVGIVGNDIAAGEQPPL